ncbi:MAG: hypothetical protein LBQ26_01645 [Holosporales bacterium]|jgi:hypothetical protein|nr:hypothetical protein [Holosporales bacterium]
MKMKRMQRQLVAKIVVPVPIEPVSNKMLEELLLEDHLPPQERMFLDGNLSLIIASTRISVIVTEWWPRKAL